MEGAGKSQRPGEYHPGHKHAKRHKHTRRKNKRNRKPKGRRKGRRRNQGTKPMQPLRLHLVYESKPQHSSQQHDANEQAMNTGREHPQHDDPEPSSHDGTISEGEATVVSQDEQPMRSVEASRRLERIPSVARLHPRGWNAYDPEVCVCVWKCTCVCMGVYVCLCAYTCLCVRVRVYACTCLRASVRVLVCGYMFAFVLSSPMLIARLQTVFLPRNHVLLSPGCTVFGRRLRERSHQA